MIDVEKTREQLITELAKFMKKIEELEALGADRRLAEEKLQRRTQELHERVKELNCLYGIARIVEEYGAAQDDILQRIAEFLPLAWLHSEAAAARITFNGRHYSSPNFRDGRQKQSAGILVDGEHRGTIEVTYSEDWPELDEGPFLEEERKLLEAVARELSLVIARWQYERDKQEIMDQLRHADRLSMVGQLAAAVAHEINEPLTNILGFAQLAIKFPGIPEQAAHDLQKIVATSLHVREVVRTLLMFSRKMPSKRIEVSLNEVVQEGLSFFQYRFAKESICLDLVLDNNLPTITADPGQLRQVMANLIVNAMQAMPDGGTLTIRTFQTEDHASVVVADTGTGMNAEVKAKIFIPFYTTKGSGKGTGLGLTVAHEIVTEHGGSIHVDSAFGQGTVITVQLPINTSAASRYAGL